MMIIIIIIITAMLLLILSVFFIIILIIIIIVVIMFIIVSSLLLLLLLLLFFFNYYYQYLLGRRTRSIRVSPSTFSFFVLPTYFIVSQHRPTTLTLEEEERLEREAVSPCLTRFILLLAMVKNKLNVSWQPLNARKLGKEATESWFGF